MKIPFWANLITFIALVVINVCDISLGYSIGKSVSDHQWRKFVEHIVQETRKMLLGEDE